LTSAEETEQISPLIWNSLWQIHICWSAIKL